MSPAYLALPVTFSSASTLLIDLPITVNSEGFFKALFLSIRLSIFCPLATSAYVTRFSLLALSNIMPSLVSSLSGLTFRCSEASSIKTALAWAAASLKSGPKKRIDIDPKVPRSQGQNSVSPVSTSTESMGTSSSSVTIWANEVITPCPISILPVRHVTLPSSPIRRYAFKPEGEIWRNAPRLLNSWKAKESLKEKKIMIPPPKILRKFRLPRTKGPFISLK